MTEPVVRAVSRLTVALLNVPAQSDEVQVSLHAKGDTPDGSATCMSVRLRPRRAPADGEPSPAAIHFQELSSMPTVSLWESEDEL